MSGAHRRPSDRRRLRRLVPSAIAVATAASFLVLAHNADAATTWFVKAGGSTNASTCGTSATPCATVTLVIGKSTFASGDVINVAAGTYTDHPLFTTKGATINGAGAGSTIFDGANAQYALGSTLPASATLTINDATFQRGAPTTGLGGGLAIGGGQVVANNVNLTNNKAALGAGAYVIQGASLTMNGGTVSGNVATATSALTGAGGAFYVAGRVGTTTPAGQLTLKNVTVSNNSAVGNNQAATGNGGAIFNAGTATITGSTFTGNTVTASTNTSNPRRGQGGAIFNGANDADDLPSLSISDTTITGGLASGSFNAASGGAIANGESFGGLAGAVLNATNVTLTGNAALVGGGLYNGGSATFSGGTIQTSSALSGAGVYQTLLVIPSAVRPSATFDGTSFLNNVASGSTLANFGNGGAIFNQATLTVRNATFTGNQAVAATVASSVSGWGGAVYNGPLAANDVPTFTVSDTSFKGGTATSNAVIGGAIANVGNVFGFSGASNGTLTATNVTFDSNSAQAAGAVYTGGTTTLTGSAFNKNSATHASAGFGGGLYASKIPATGPNPVVTIDSTTFTSNSATILGGGLAIGAGMSVELRNSSNVATNSSAVSAGGIYNDGALTVRNSAVSGNSATFQGGGIYSGSTTATDTPSVSLVNAVVDNNTAANVGGGILSLTNSTLTGTGGEVSGNTALGGGGIYVADNAPASFDGTTFADNTATSSGGGAILNAGTLTLTHSNLNGNTAAHPSGNLGLGGAIYSGSNNDNVTTKLTVNASAITANAAWAGAALVTYSPGSGASNATSISNTTIAGNSNGSVVGSIDQLYPLTIVNSTITDNTAASGGSGSLYLGAPASAGIAGTILSNNSGGSCSGGHPVDGGYNLTDPGDASCGFTAANHDVSAAPQLGALGDNGGATPSRLPGPASPALDRIPAATGTSLSDVVSGSAVTLCAAGSADQRDVARPQGAKCDIGSVEAAQIAPTLTGPASVDYSIGNMGTAVTFKTTGSPQPTLSESGALPAGVTFVDNGDGTATISGTPTHGPGGHYVVTVTATNEAGSDSKTFDLVLHEAPVLGGPASATYTVGVAGQPQVFKMVSGFPPATLSTTSALPNGVTFVDNGDGTATLSGTPAAGTGGVYTIVIKGTNGTPPDGSLTFVLTVDEQPSVTGPASATFTVGSAGSSGEFSTTGFPTPTLSASGLPAGLSLVSTGPGKAKISGTPADGTGGEYDVTVTATNGVGSAATTAVHLVVNEAPGISGPTTARFVTGSPGTIAYATDGYPQATLTESGALPAGVHFDTANGTATLSGTAAAGQEGVYNITITASNGIAPDAVLHLVLTVVPPVSITTSTLPDAPVGTAYGAQLVASGGQPAYHFSIVSGSLPAGLSLADDGSITGTATGPTGTRSLTVKVVDSASPAQSATKVVSITVVRGTSTLVVQPVLVKTTKSPLGVKITIGTVSATLTGGTLNIPIPGQHVVFKAQNTTTQVCAGTTGSSGVVTCSMSLTATLTAIAKGGVTASFAGNALWLPATGQAGLVQLS